MRCAAYYMKNIQKIDKTLWILNASNGDRMHWKYYVIITWLAASGQSAPDGAYLWTPYVYIRLIPGK